jgi:hypothetical protein
MLDEDADTKQACVRHCKVRTLEEELWQRSDNCQVPERSVY